MGGLTEVFVPQKPKDPPEVPRVKQVDPEEEARKAREETLSRQRRGLAGLITTSAGGVLDRATAGLRKSLLGE